MAALILNTPIRYEMAPARVSTPMTIAAASDLVLVNAPMKPIAKIETKAAGYMATRIRVLLLPSNLRAQFASMTVQIILTRPNRALTPERMPNSRIRIQWRFGGSGTGGTGASAGAAAGA